MRLDRVTDRTGRTVRMGVAALAVLAAGFGVAGVEATAQTSQAADTTGRAVTIIVPFSAGGPADTIARLIAPAMAAELDRPVIVANQPGAGGSAGAAHVAASPADGHTLLLHNVGMATSTSIDPDLPFDPEIDFAPIGLVSTTPMVIAARPDYPATTMADLVERLRAEPAGTTIGHAGTGSASHLCAMLLGEAIDTPLATIAYGGTRPALDDLMVGSLDLICDQATNAKTAVTGAAIRAYAVTTPDHLPTLPDLPTTAEAGLPEVVLTVWHGLWAPAGTPEETINRLTAALQVAVADETVVSRLTALDTAPAARDEATPDALAAHLSAEIDRWAPLIEAAHRYAD